MVPQHRWHRVLWTPTQIAVHELSSYWGFMMPAQLDASDTNADCAITSSQKEAPGDMLSIQQVYLCSGSGNEWVNEWGKWAKDHSIHSFLSNKRFSFWLSTMAFPSLFLLYLYIFSSGNREIRQLFFPHIFSFTFTFPILFCSQDLWFLISPCYHSTWIERGPLFPSAPHSTPGEPLSTVPLLMAAFFTHFLIACPGLSHLN